MCSPSERSPTGCGRRRSETSCVSSSTLEAAPRRGQGLARRCAALRPRGAAPRGDRAHHRSARRSSAHRRLRDGAPSGRGRARLRRQRARGGRPSHATSGRDQLETIVARVGRRAVFLSGPGPRRSPRRCRDATLDVVSRKVHAGRAPLVRGRRRAVPPPRSARRWPARQPGARAAARRPHLLQPQPARRGDERLRRLVPLLLVREARGGRSRSPHHDARGGVARARGAHERPARRDPHRQRAATRGCRSRTTRSCSGLEAHQARRAPRSASRRSRSTSWRGTSA